LELPYAQYRRRHAGHVIGIQKGAVAEAVRARQLARVAFYFLEVGELGPGIRHAVLQRLAHVRRERVGVERLAGDDADLREAFHQRIFGGIGRTVLKHEVQHIEEA
jgi:hypothetical protein